MKRQSPLRQGNSELLVLVEGGVASFGVARVPLSAIHGRRILRVSLIPRRPRPPVGCPLVGETAHSLDAGRVPERLAHRLATADTHVPRLPGRAGRGGFSAGTASGLHSHIGRLDGGDEDPAAFATIAGSTRVPSRSTIPGGPAFRGFLGDVVVESRLDHGIVTVFSARTGSTKPAVLPATARTSLGNEGQDAQDLLRRHEDVPASLTGAATVTRGARVTGVPWVFSRCRGRGLGKIPGKVALLGRAARGVDRTAFGVDQPGVQPNVSPGQGQCLAVWQSNDVRVNDEVPFRVELRLLEQDLDGHVLDSVLGDVALALEVVGQLRSHESVFRKTRAPSHARQTLPEFGMDRATALEFTARLH